MEKRRNENKQKDNLGTFIFLEIVKIKTYVKDRFIFNLMQTLELKMHTVGSISISVTVNYERIICHSAGSPPSLPRPSHPPQWASDGEEPSPHFSIRSDVSLITEIEKLTTQLSTVALQIKLNYYNGNLQR